ncbi:hypothetical protein CSQ95_20895 [Janthinobacterium sp. BJB304]|nr:hypothetical protein CSQ95_20895 [Janthinobacterium sp. BJB304]
MKPCALICASKAARICRQILLGDEAFISAHQQSQRTETPRDTPRSQRCAVMLSLEQFRAHYSDRDEAMARAYLSQGTYFHFNNNCIRVIAAILNM